MWCCIRSDCFKDTIHCLTEDYFSNYLLSLAPKTGLNTNIFKAQFFNVPPLIWKCNIKVCEEHTSLDVSSTFYPPEIFISVIQVINLSHALTLFYRWPCNLGYCNLLETRSISYSSKFLQCAKVYMTEVHR